MPVHFTTAVFPPSPDVITHLPSPTPVHSIPSCPGLHCAFCESSGHLEQDCLQYKACKKQAIQERQHRWKKKRKMKKTAITGSVSTHPSSTPEVAGNATLPPSNSPGPLSFDWLADTGATSHMTPHRHWFLLVYEIQTLLVT